MLSLQDKRAFNLFKLGVFANIKIERAAGEFISYLDGVNEHEGQQLIHFPEESWQYYVAVWGRRTGKTIAAASEAVAVAGVPKTKTWIVAPTYELTDRVFEYVWNALVIQRIYGPDSVVKQAKTPNNRYIELNNGSIIRGKSGESPDSLIGEQLDFLILDEASRLGEEIWNQNLRPTLLDRKGRALFISTPTGYNWFKNYYERGLDPEEKLWHCSKFPTWENPFIDEEWLFTEKAQTPEVIWNQEYGASFEHRSGLIWPEFSDREYPKGHIFDPTEHPIPAYWRHIRSIDVGYRHDTAGLWAAIDEEHNVWVYGEYLQQDIDHESHAQNIATRTIYPVSLTWISPDAKRKNPLTSSARDKLSAWDIYRRNGIYARPAVNEVGPGLATVARYLRATLEDSSSHPRLMISKNCPKLILALQNYIFHEAKMVRELDPPDKPRKFKDDLPDALRYLLATTPRYQHSNDTFQQILKPLEDKSKLRVAQFYY